MGRQDSRELPSRHLGGQQCVQFAGLKDLEKLHLGIVDRISKVSGHQKVGDPHLDFSLQTSVKFALQDKPADKIINSMC